MQNPTESTASVQAEWQTRDQRITFDEAAHAYHVDGESYPSVTTVISAFFSQFDADAVIAQMMARSNWPNSKYYGQTPEQIKAGWEQKKQEAGDEGTRMHAEIEAYLLEEARADSLEFKLFMEYWEANDLSPVKVEWRIFDDALKVAGTLDLLARDGEGRFHLIDWKRKQKIEKKNWGRYANIPLDDVPDADFFKASLQLNLYRNILKNYNVDVDVMALVQIHPDAGLNRLVVPDMSSEIELLRHEMEMAL